MSNESQRVLLVLAHPDDSEYFCGATLAKWARAGKEIRYLLLTSGEKGIDDPTMTPEKIGAIRQAEQREAAQVIGAKGVAFLKYCDGELVNTSEVRREIVREIRRFRPPIIVTSDPTTYFTGNTYPNHADHRAAGAATLEAVWPSAGSRMYFPGLLEEGFGPYSPQQVWLALTNQPNTSVNVTDTIDLKIAALLKHKSQINESPEELMKRIRGRRRLPIAQGYREKFRVIRLA